MDAEAVCIICNWANNVLWPYFGLGALGAGAAAAAATGALGLGLGGSAYPPDPDAAYDPEHPPSDRPYRPTSPDEVGDSSYAPGWEPTDEQLERWDQTWKNRQPEYWRSKDPNLTWYEDFQDWLEIWARDVTGDLGYDGSVPAASKA